MFIFELKIEKIEFLFKIEILTEYYSLFLKYSYKVNKSIIRFFTNHYL